MDHAGLALALVAGAVAAFNPCGFALLPAYLTMLVTRAEGSPIGRALRFTAGMTLGFVAVFGVFGLVIAPLALSIERWLPVLTIVVGAVLVALGGWLLAGHTLALPALHRRGRAPTGSWSSQIGYGVTFALVSLSCTIAPFLAVTTSALRSGSLLGAITAFIVYAVGMGVVVGVLAVAATTTTTLTQRLRRATPVIARLSGALLVVAGLYVAWYGWFELRVLADARTHDPVIQAGLEVQTWLTRAVAGIGAPGLLALGVLGALGGLVLVHAAFLARRRRRPANIATASPVPTAEMSAEARHQALREDGAP